MHIFGLTGGIATGKSTVSQMFRDEGVAVVDADQLARDVVAPGQSALLEITTRFPTAVTADGQLDRARLGTLVFADAAQRAALNSIIHPHIHALATRALENLATGGAQVALYDAALLIENDLPQRLGLSGVILVVCSAETQRLRLQKRNSLSESEASARISAQMPLEQKRAHATWVIDNEGNLELTRAQVHKIIADWSRYGVKL